MSASDEQFKKKLIERYVAGEASEKELQAFFGLLTEAEIDSLVEEHMDQEILRLREEQGLLKPVKRLTIWKYAAAASILILFSLGGYYIFHKQTQKDQIAQNQNRDFKPGHNQATLTLANGQKIILTKGLTGKLAQQGSTIIQVNSGNAIAYTATTAPQAIQYNTMSTAKGEQSPYPLILADGTKVWLNAESSITFPTSFNGKERIVKITGEAYFEVMHKSAAPFKVTVRGQTVEDIGTRFDINAYADEPAIVTTLVQGSVSVTEGSRKVILSPGQKSSVNGDNPISVKSADVDNAIAWTNGYFAFKQADIKTVMRQFSRWYNVDVAYEGTLPTTMITGKAYRNVNASEALTILTDLGIHYKIENKKIIIIPD